MELFFWSIIEPNTEILKHALGITSNYFFKQTLCNFKNQIHTFFFPLRSSILKLNYICDFRSSIFDTQHWSSPLNSILNAIGLTWFWFSKTKLCPISHNDLIMDWFSIANLYDLPRVTVPSFVSEMDIQETKFCVLVTNFYGTPIRCPERELLNFFHDHLFEMQFRSLKKHYLPQIISQKLLRTKLWNFLTSFLRISSSHHKNFRFWNFVEKNL